MTFQPIVIVLVLTTFCLAAVNCQGVPECLAASLAPNATMKLYNLVSSSSLSSFVGVTTTEGVIGAVVKIISVMSSLASPVDALLVGTDNHESYSVASVGGSVWKIQVSNARAFGDSRRRKVFIDTSANDPLSFAGAAIGSEYDAVTRPWFKSGEGWITYNFVDSTQNGSTYYKSFTGGVVAADRDFAEPCGNCLASSLALPIANLVKFAPSQLARDQADWRDVIQSIFSVFASLKNSHISEAYVGLSDGRFYSVVDCKSDPSTCQGASSPYVAQLVTLSTVGTVTTFPLSAAGMVVGGALPNTFPYDPRTRPWYRLAKGWTKTYQFAAGSNLIARTYALPIQGGVVGVDRLDTEPCDGCEVPSSPPSCQGSWASTAININFAGILSGMK